MENEIVSCRKVKQLTERYCDLAIAINNAMHAEHAIGRIEVDAFLARAG
jgi:hypothetical protein